MNIAEILKYCPEGTKLYSTVHGEVVLNSVHEKSAFPVYVVTEGVAHESFTKEGCMYENTGECILFPSKNQRDWSKFRIPVKRGDIMMLIDGKTPFIASGKVNINNSPKYICGITIGGNFTTDKGNHWTSDFYIPASEEVKKKLFKAMKEAGYKWNSETLELEKMEEIKFKPFDKVLVRDTHERPWLASLFSNYNNTSTSYKFTCVSNGSYRYCIPYEGNEHLVGTNKDK